MPEHERRVRTAVAAAAAAEPRQLLIDYILLLLCRFVPALRDTTPDIPPAVEPVPTLPEEHTPSLAGIPAEHVAGVRELQKRLAPFIKEEGEAALSEPLMLLRFLLARECDPAEGRRDVARDARLAAAPRAARAGGARALRIRTTAR